MRSSQEIINFIKEAKEDIENINHIPKKDTSLEEKGALVIARQELSTTLQLILDFAESERSSEGEKKHDELLP